MFCKKCGKSNEDGAKFCKYCGTPFVQVSRGQNNMTQVNQPPRNDGGPQKWIITVAVFIIAIALAVLAAILVKKYFIDEDVSKTEETTQNVIATEVVTEQQTEAVSQDVEIATEVVSQDVEIATEVDIKSAVIDGLKDYYGGKINNQNNSSNDYGQYVIPNSNSIYLTTSDLDALTPAQLKIARNEIYARHGRRFDDKGLQSYFDSCPWYDGTVAPSDFSEKVFNDYEKFNKDFIREYEKERGYNK